MRKNVFMMLGAIVLALSALVVLGALSYGWAYTDTTFGGHAGFIGMIVAGVLLFVAGVIFGHHEADHRWEHNFVDQADDSYFEFGGRSHHAS